MEFNNKLNIIFYVILFIILFSLLKFIYVKFFKKKQYDFYIINLDSQPDRLNDINNEMKYHNIKYNKIHGVNGNTINRKRLKDQNLITAKTKNIQKNKLGCTMSHRNAWLRAYNNINNKDNDIIVLEDNVYLRDDFNNQLDKLTKQLNNTEYDLCIIGRDISKENKKKEEKLDENIKIPIKDTGIYGYILKRESIPKIMKYFYPIKKTLGEEIWEHDLKIVSSNPLLVLK